MSGDPITAILDLLAAHAERISQLDAQAGTFAEAAARTTELAALARSMTQRIAGLAARVDHIAPGGPASAAGSAADLPYVSAPARRWWMLTGQDREHAIGRLRAWVDQVYRPGYGQLAGALGPCWDQHALCLYALDILAELWSVLYLAGERTPALLAMQAEYQARVLPALAEQMAAETTRCRHAREHLPVAGQSRRVS